MKQRVVVQAIIQTDGKTLLLHRCQGRPAIVGKYELPGGTLERSEQPEDGLRRHVQVETGLHAKTLQLADVISMVSREEGDVQHILIAYTVSGLAVDEPITLGRSYDAYEWKQLSEVQPDELRDSAQLLLGLYGAEKLLPEVVPSYQSVDVNSTTKYPSVVIYSDGGSRGNPGPSAAAFVIMNKQLDILDQGGIYLGITTNNQAEYHGVQLGLECAFKRGIAVIEFRIDSMLVVNQMKGLYKIKNRELWPINERIRSLIDKFEKVTFTHVPRELNQFADALVNKLLDEHQNDSAVI
ncbi:reverse transcriptase-like protein [Candidatus Saccharibacteria bacterium]|nr:reverse transcriptase-like protein [Candidatus Saccharibacteria bacterium]